MKLRKKIFIIIPKYKIGGAEKVMVALANELSKFNIEIFFIVLTKSRKIKLNKKIKLINFSSTRVIYSIFMLKKLIDKIKPEICLSTISHTNLILFFASKFSKHNCKTILRESNNIFESLKKLNFFFKILFLILLKFAYQNSILISPSKNLSKELKKKFSIKKKVYHIRNPIIEEKIKKTTYQKYDFINIASLTHQKDHITLLKAFKIALDTNRKLKLIIIGEGIFKKKILDFIRINKLTNNILLTDYKKNFVKYLNNSKIFILSSRYEGYPNVLLDAANNRLPIISTNCKHGPNEILSNGKYGKLFKVGNYEELSKFMLCKHKSIKIIPKNNLKYNKLSTVGKKYYELFFRKNF